MSAFADTREDAANERVPPPYVRRSKPFDVMLTCVFTPVENICSTYRNAQQVNLSSEKNLTQRRRCDVVQTAAACTGANQRESYLV
jgi:hypothetical protein